MTRLLLVCMSVLAGCSPDSLDAALARESLSEAAQEAVMDQLGARRTLLPPRADVRPLAVPSQTSATLPKTIKVWRRALDGSTASCSGRVDTLDFEDYVKGVLPHEWITSWDVQSLKAGAVAIRTYAWYWVNAGGKYTCADIDDTTASQVYKDARVAKASQSVDDTRGQTVVTAAGAPVFAEYSAENSDPTADGVSEPYCTGKALNGHGHGMCQWGSQRWALAGKDYQFIVAHYYPGKSLTGTGPAWAARLGARQAPPAEMTSGEEATVWIEYANDGSSAWSTTDTRVGTTAPRDRASVFVAPQNWISPSRPTAADQSTAQGATGRFSFVMRAPEVDKDTSFTEDFGLVQENVTWFGPPDDAVSFTILVHPKKTQSIDPPGNTGEQPGGTGGMPTTAGCEVAPRGGGGPLAMLLVLFGALVARRRRDNV